MKAGTLVVAVMAGVLAACAPTETQRTDSRHAAAINVDLAKAYIREGDTTQAMRKLQRALAQAPNFAPAHGTLAVLYNRLGETDQAEEHFKKALKLKPDAPSVRNNYGTFLCAQSRWPEAEKQFLRAAKNPLYETPEYAYTNAGLCALRSSQTESAERYFASALRHNPRYAVALFNMAQLSFQRDQFLRTRAYVQRYSEVAPFTPAVLWLGILAERQLGDRDAAGNYAVRLKTMFPDSQQARLLAELEKRER